MDFTVVGSGFLTEEKPPKKQLFYFLIREHEDGCLISLINFSLLSSVTLPIGNV